MQPQQTKHLPQQSRLPQMLQGPEIVLTDLSAVATKEARRLAFLRPVARALFLGLIAFIFLGSVESDYQRHGWPIVAVKLFVCLVQMIILPRLMGPFTTGRLQWALRDALPYLRKAGRESLEPILFLMVACVDPAESVSHSSHQRRWQLEREFGTLAREHVAQWLARLPAGEVDDLSPQAQKALVTLTERALRASRRPYQKDLTHARFATAALLVLATLRQGSFSAYATHPDPQVAAAVQEHSSALL
jgi:hypothetical protein